MQCYKSLGKGEDSNSIEHNILMCPWESALIIKDLHNFYGGNHVSHRLSISKESLLYWPVWRAWKQMLLPKTSLEPHSTKGARGFYWHIWCPWVASITIEFAKTSLTGLGIISLQAALLRLGAVFCIMLVQLAEKHWLFACSAFSSSSCRENMLALCPTNVIFVCAVF